MHADITLSGCFSFHRGGARGVREVVVVGGFSRMRKSSCAICAAATSERSSSSPTLSPSLSLLPLTPSLTLFPVQHFCRARSPSPSSTSTHSPFQPCLPGTPLSLVPFYLLPSQQLTRHSPVDSSCTSSSNCTVRPSSSTFPSLSSSSRQQLTYPPLPPFLATLNSAPRASAPASPAATSPPPPPRASLLLLFPSVFFSLTSPPSRTAPRPAPAAATHRLAPVL